MPCNYSRVLCDSTLNSFFAMIFGRFLMAGTAGLIVSVRKNKLSILLAGTAGLILSVRKNKLSILLAGTAGLLLTYGKEMPIRTC